MAVLISKEAGAFSVIVADEPKLRQLIMEEFSYFPPEIRYRPLRLLIDIEPDTVVMMWKFACKHGLIISKDFDALLKQYHLKGE